MTSYLILQSSIIFLFAIVFAIAYSWAFQWILRKFNINSTYGQAFKIYSLSIIPWYLFNLLLVFITINPFIGLVFDPIFATLRISLLISFAILYSATLFILFEKIFIKQSIALLLAVLSGLSLLLLGDFPILVFALFMLFAVALFRVLQKNMPPFRYRKYLIFLLASSSFFLLMSPLGYAMLLDPLTLIHYSSSGLILGIVPGFFVFYYLTKRLKPMPFNKSVSIYLSTLIVPFLFSGLLELYYSKYVVEIYFLEMLLLNEL